ncbi:MAG: Gfo/Idh/MocA family oxidoreductase, partial [Bryobacterales bacterium]|nr:Gfo/Idh/MocA family oxidoreductase [Bryobacterales bacterium]
MSQSSQLRGAIIGCGFFGRIQLEAWSRMPGVEMVAACDPVLARAQEAAPRAYADPAEMLANEQLDFVDIATRPDTHLPLVKLAVGHELPAICQKPLAESIEQALEMRDVVRASGVPVMIHENWRWQPWYREVNRLVGEGRIGAPITYTFRIRQRDGLGPDAFPNQPYFREMRRLLIFETLIHPVDTARFLFGDIATVYAKVRRYNPVIQGEDRAILVLTHTSGMDGVVDGHRFLNPEPPGPAMGDAVFEGEEGTLRVLATGEIWQAGECIYQNPPQTGYKGDSVLATQQHFVDCLRSGEPFETSVDDYLKSFAVVEAAYRS